MSLFVLFSPLVMLETVPAVLRSPSFDEPSCDLPCDDEIWHRRPVLSLLEPECYIERDPPTPLRGGLDVVPYPRLPTLEELTLKGSGVKDRSVEYSGYVMALYDPVEMEKEIVQKKSRIEKARANFVNNGVIAQKARDVLEWIKRRESPTKNSTRSELTPRDRILDIQRTYFTMYFPLMKEIGDAEAREKRDKVLMEKALKY